MFAIQSPIGTTSAREEAIRGRATPACFPFAPDDDAGQQATIPYASMAALGAQRRSTHLDSYTPRASGALLLRMPQRLHLVQMQLVGCLGASGSASAQSAGSEAWT